MPRRFIPTEAQRADLLALPEDEAALVRHWTLSAEDLRIIVSRRRPHNRLGFAIQLCGLRYPGRQLRPGEVIRQAPPRLRRRAARHRAGSIGRLCGAWPDPLEQLDTLRDVFGFQPFSRPVGAELQA